MQRRRTAASNFIRPIAVLAMVVLASACQPSSPADQAESGAISLPRARSYTERLAHLPAEALSDADIIALGYQERARIGMGSPFRLIDFALADPELDAETRNAVAYAILAQAQAGRTYEVDPRVLDLVDLAGGAAGAAAGVRQLELIERVIGIAPTAESGERIVRLGYELAAAERTVATSFPSVVAHVAALVADRRRAREDANRLIAAARAARTSPIELISAWRADRRFRVEGPAMSSLSVREEEAIASQGPRTALAIRALAQRLAVPGAPGAAASNLVDHSPLSLLDAGTAARLLEIASRRDYPPQAPISVALLINRDSYVDAAGAAPDGRAARQLFVDSTYSEERFAAGIALQDAGSAAAAVRLRLIQLQAAVFFRVWNQERPWFPGDPAPATKDLVARFGLQGVDFGSAVPESWRPYYRWMLAHGLTDLQRVLPTASLRGLTIRFDDLPDDRRALALHDPGSRTLYLPTRTGAGTLAHEIAHDLDWQLARKRYGSRGGYATDLAIRGRRRDRIAYALSGLAASLTQPDSVRKPHDTRPTEVFARGTDWFVAAALASDGRAGGYLTSFQDPALTGYGTTRGPDVGGGAVGSLLDILGAVAPLSSGAIESALEAHGPQRRLAPSELARAVAGAGSELPAEERFFTIGATREHSLTMIDNATCRMSSAEGLRRLSSAQRGLIDAAAAAAGRGAAIEAARLLGAGSSVPAALTDAWMASRLYGAPEPADSALLELEPGLDQLVYQARTLQQESELQLVDPFDFTPATRLCGGNPFASELRQRRPGRAMNSLDRL
jgi:hypothetical protein